MAIRIDIHSIKNVDRTGTERPYVKLIPQPARTVEELEEDIQQSCTLTRSDIRAVLTALHAVIRRDLAEHGTFHLPEVGYLTLRLMNSSPEDTKTGKLKGNQVGVRTIRFRPEAKLLREVRRDARFQCLKGTTCSRQWTADDLREALTAYLHDHLFITARTMRTAFQLTEYSARQWLRRFVADGLLAREGARTSPVYTLATATAKP